MDIEPLRSLCSHSLQRGFIISHRNFNSTATSRSSFFIGWLKIFTRVGFNNMGLELFFNLISCYNFLYLQYFYFWNSCLFWTLVYLTFKNNYCFNLWITSESIEYIYVDIVMLVDYFNDLSLFFKFFLFFLSSKFFRATHGRSCSLHKHH